MTITVNLTPTEEARLSNEAMKIGLAPAELVQQLLREHFSKPLNKVDAVRAKLHQWQKDTQTQTTPAISAHDLFARWAEEDALMTEEEKEAEGKLWQDFQTGINETRASLGMRQL